MITTRPFDESLDECVVGLPLLSRILDSSIPGSVQLLPDGFVVPNESCHE